jgi:hypothetical protein
MLPHSKRVCVLRASRVGVDPLHGNNESLNRLPGKEASHTLVDHVSFSTKEMGMDTMWQ